MRRATPGRAAPVVRAPRAGVRALGRRLRVLAPLVMLATGACVATRQDVQLLQNDIATLRTEQLARDSARAAQLDRVVATLGTVSDSLRLVSTRLAQFQGDVRGDLFTTNQQLIQIQELTGQSQRRLLELRAGLEERAQSVVPAPAVPALPPASPSAPVATPPGTQPAAQPPVASSAAAPAGPGPNQLFQLSLDQLRRGSAGAARAGFQDLLKQYPGSDLAGDAQFYLGEAWAAEGKPAQADSAYALVVERYPTSERAPTAMYKRAIALQASGGTVQARTLLESVVSRFPRSDEAELARERLRTLPR